MSAVSIKHFFSTTEEIKPTKASQNAKKYTQLSFDAQTNKKYLEAWKLSIPAKLCYLADLVFHACMMPITLLKIIFGSIKALYSWGEDTIFLQKNLQVLHSHLNTAIADAVGIFLIKTNIGKKSLRKNNNVRDLITISVLVSAIAVGVFAMKRVDNFKVIYDPESNSFKPAINWKL